ncbi:MAG: D-3-phosphoglycerate dehydrogenase [Arenicella sp.]|jgi:D-3-phosphoglycerate dehydrogenase
MKIAFLDIVHEVLEEGLKSLGHQCDDLTTSSAEDINKSIGTFEGIVVRSRFPINSEFLVKCTSLRFIARSGAGMENIDIEYCEENNIQLFNAPEGNRNAVGEHALGMLLSLFNNLSKGDSEIRRGKWDREGNRGIELDGKTVGIIGFGNNGSAFAKKLRGFEVEVLAYDKYKNDFGDDFVIESELDDLFEKADVLSFHIPQNEETIWMANEDFFKKFNKNIWLINLARGKLVETGALLNAIEKGKVLGACLDVLEFEKASFENVFDGNMMHDFQKLLKSEKVLLSPHVGGWTVESYYKLSKVLLEKIENHFHS